MLRFGAGITSSDLTVTEDANELLVQAESILGQGDSIRINDWAPGVATIERFVFENGTSVDRAAIDALNTGNHSPRAVGSISQQTAKVGQTFSFQVPGSFLSDADAGDTLTYTATLADGSALPAWLTFNAASRTFSGTASLSDAGISSLRVTLTDAVGLLEHALELRVATAIVLNGTEAGNVLAAPTSDDYQINGLGGNDTLTGNGGDDVLVGETGDDQLGGGVGSDRYIYNLGDGTDTIQFRNDSASSSIDTLEFGVGIEPNNVLVTGNAFSGDLRLSIWDPAANREVGNVYVLQGMSDNGTRVLDQVVSRERHDLDLGYAPRQGADRHARRRHPPDVYCKILCWATVETTTCAPEAATITSPVAPATIASKAGTAATPSTSGAARGWTNTGTLPVSTGSCSMLASCRRT